MLIILVLLLYTYRPCQHNWNNHKVLFWLLWINGWIQIENHYITNFLNYRIRIKQFTEMSGLIWTKKSLNVQTDVLLVSKSNVEFNFPLCWFCFDSASINIDFFPSLTSIAFMKASIHVLGEFFRKKNWLIKV